MNIQYTQEMLNYHLQRTQRHIFLVSKYIKEE